MTFQFLSKKQGNKKLLLFFNGWGMNEAAIGHLVPPEGYDILVAYDYRNFTSFPHEVEQYESILLVAWSIGVWAVEQLRQRGLLPKVEYSLAIAGSPFIRHNRFGIPCKVFDLTLQSLNDSSREVFNRRMCGGKSNVALFKEFEKRETEELREELNTVREIELARQEERLLFYWNRIFIAQKDKIIPPQNLFTLSQSYGIPQDSFPDASHFLFQDFQYWQELLDRLS